MATKDDDYKFGYVFVMFDLLVNVFEVIHEHV
jgi:hypothetical protein